jgi:predicted permease
VTPVIYRLLIRLCPREFRHRFGDELMATAAEASGRGWGSRTRAFGDALVTVIGLRCDLRRERRIGGAFRSDVRASWRSLVRSPGVFVAGVLTLGLGIGGFTVVYAIVDALLLRPLPFGERSDRLVTLHSTHPSQARDWDDSELSYADLVDLRERSEAFTAVEGVLDRNFSVATTDDNARVLGASVTPGLFSLLGVEPMVGRLFRDDEAALPGLEPVVIISHLLWQRLLGSDPDIVGRSVLLNARPVTVIGVMPEGFLFPEQHQLWLPYAGDRVAGRGNRALIGVGLLAPDVTRPQAALDVDRVATALAREFPDTNREWGIHVLPLREFYIGSASGLAAMLGAVVVLLLVACANVGGLLTARGLGRTQELVTRAALGAGRRRLITLLLTEAVMIAALGGLLGIILSFWGLRLTMATLTELPAYWALPTIDVRVLAWALAATTVVALAAGLVPAWRLSRVDVSAAGSTSRLAGGTRGSRRTQQALVVAQVAASLVLISGAVLLARSAVALQQADPGFDTGPLLSARFYIAGDAYDPIRDRAAAVSRVVDAVAALPGVTSAAVTQAIPADDGGGTVIVAMPGSTEPVGVSAIATTSGLWDTLGLRLHDGRSFTAAEHADPDADVAIVNVRLARRFWKTESPVGATLQVVNARGDVTTTLRVVGVAPDLVYEEFGEVTPQAELNVYVPYAMSGGRTLAILARGASGVAPADGEALRRAVRSVDGSFATFDILTMTDRRLVTTWGERFIARTFSGFALGALILACLGTWAVVAYAVAQRRREVGVRLAIGASRADVIGLFVRGGLTLALAGLAAGVVPALLAVRALEAEGLLFNQSPWSLPLWATLATALVAAVAVATIQPAWRAGRVEPVDVLRE